MVVSFEVKFVNTLAECPTNFSLNNSNFLIFYNYKLNYFSLYKDDYSQRN